MGVTDLLLSAVKSSSNAPVFDYRRYNPQIPQLFPGEEDKGQKISGYLKELLRLLVEARRLQLKEESEKLKRELNEWEKSSGGYVGFSSSRR